MSRKKYKISETFLLTVQDNCAMFNSGTRFLDFRGGEIMGSEPYQRIIMNLRAVIDESGLKQKVVAERAGMKPAQLNNILCFRKRLDVAYIPVFCIILNTTPDRIYEGTIS